jgi:hypothetical protein
MNKPPITNNIYGLSGAGYRLLADNVEKYPDDTHYVKPFLPTSDETSEITPAQIPGFCAWLREEAMKLEQGENRN